VLNVNGQRTKENHLKSLTIFVAMPFGETFDDVFNHGIRPIERQFPGWSLTVLRADLTHNRDSQLWLHVRSSIESADVMVCDVSGNNPNVMLELGFAMATGKHCVLLSQDRLTAANIRGHLYVPYSRDDWQGLQKNLVHQIEGILREVVTARSQMRPSALGKGRSMWKSPPPTHRSDLPKDATQQRDLGFLARERGNLDEATQHYQKALELHGDFWEVKYDLALTKSLGKEEASAFTLAREAASGALAHQDFTTAWKAHNLMSGIYRRANRLSEALNEIRRAWEFSHMKDALVDGVPHIVPIKNRAVLESVQNNAVEYQLMQTELRQHPALAEVLEELKKELGPTFLVD
jgi:tetratricopeptide (TPR) repeat protein